MYRFVRLEVTKSRGRNVKERLFILYEGDLQGLFQKIKGTKFYSIYRYSFEIHYKFFQKTSDGWLMISDPRID